MSRLLACTRSSDKDACLRTGTLVLMKNYWSTRSRHTAERPSLFLASVDRSLSRLPSRKHFRTPPHKRDISDLQKFNSCQGAMSLKHLQSKSIRLRLQTICSAEMHMRVSRVLPRGTVCITYKHYLSRYAPVLL